MFQRRMPLLVACLVLTNSLMHNCEAAEPKTTIYAGGVAGITDLVDPKNSKAYRAAGGGLYLHNSGWIPLDRQQKEQILAVFKGSPIAIEIGYGVNDRVQAWAALLKTSYLDLGISARLPDPPALRANP